MNHALSDRSSKPNFRKGGVNRLPSWFKQDIPDESVFRVGQLISEFNVHTVCQKAKCPNISRCFKSNKATFIILGGACTRNCRFCAVPKAENKEMELDPSEPQRLSELVKILGLSYVVITSVTRDDLIDGGSSIFVETIRLIRSANKEIKVEVLIPDFQGRFSSLKCVADSRPDILAHNIETVRRLYTHLRPQADYARSLNLLSEIKKINFGIITKSSMILGLGETKREVILTLGDLRNAGCDIVAIGQYLAPSREHFPVKRFIAPEEFKRYKNIGLELGFREIISGPLVRSSYRAEEVYESLQAACYKLQA